MHRQGFKPLVLFALESGGESGGGGQKAICYTAGTIYSSLNNKWLHCISNTKHDALTVPYLSVQMECNTCVRSV